MKRFIAVALAASMVLASVPAAAQIDRGNAYEEALALGACTSTDEGELVRANWEDETRSKIIVECSDSGTIGWGAAGLGALVLLGLAVSGGSDGDSDSTSSTR